MVTMALGGRALVSQAHPSYLVLSTETVGILLLLGAHGLWRVQSGPSWAQQAGPPGRAHRSRDRIFPHGHSGVTAPGP